MYVEFTNFLKCFSSIYFRKTPSSDISSVAGSLTSNKSSISRSSEEQMPGDITVVTPGLSSRNGSTGNIVTVTVLREDLRKKAEEVCLNLIFNLPKTEDIQTQYIEKIQEVMSIFTFFVSDG